MFEGLAHICQVTGVAELIVASAGFIIVALVAVWRKLSSSPPSSAEIASGAERFRQLYGEAAVRRIGAKMHQERVANGIGRRYRLLSEISERLSNLRRIRE